MADIHKKLYATLVGDVDDTISLIADLIFQEECGKIELQEVALHLKAALEKVEEMYIDSAEEDEEE